MKAFTYRHTKYASYTGYVTQAIVNNLSPLLFIIFQKEFEISLGKIGLLISLNFGVQILVDLLAAHYVDKTGYRRAVIFAHICCAAGLVGLGCFPYLFENAYAGLMLAVVINAVGGGLIEVLISPIVEALPGDEKASAMSMLHSFYCWGHVSVVILSTLYFRLAGIENWRLLPMIWAIVPLLNTFFFAAVPIRTLTGPGEGISLKKLFRLKLFWLFFLMMICSGASEQAMSQWASLFAEEGLKVSKTMGDLLGPCAFAFLMGLSRLIYGIYGSRMNLHKVITGGSILCVCSYLTAVFAPHPLLALAGCALCGFSVGIMWPGVFSLASGQYSHGGTAMFAMLALAGDVGCSAGPGLVGVVSGAFGGLQSGLLSALVFPALLLLCILILKSVKTDKRLKHEK